MISFDLRGRYTKSQIECIAVKILKGLLINNVFTELVGNHVILKAAGDLLAYGLDVYHEINKSCPFPGWKKGLVDDL